MIVTPKELANACEAKLHAAEKLAERYREALEWMTTAVVNVGVNGDGSPMKGHPDGGMCRYRALQALASADGSEGER